MDLRFCGNCNFYLPDDDDESGESLAHSYGTCRRYPPKVTPAEESRVPMVDYDWWCGEHKKNLPKLTSN